MKEQIKACQEALIQDPNNREAFEKLAEILKENRQWKVLIGLHEKYSEQANWQKLIVTLSDAADEDGDAETKSSLYYVTGQIAERKLGGGNDAISLALQYYQKAVKAWPGRQESFDAARRIYRSLNKIDMVGKLAILELKTAKEPEHKARLLMELCLMFKDAGNVEKAAEFEAKARELDALTVDIVLALQSTEGSVIKAEKARRAIAQEEFSKELVQAYQEEKAKAEDAKSEEVAEESKSEEVAEDAKSEEVAEEAKSDAQEEFSKELVQAYQEEKAKAEEAKSEEVAEDAKSDEVAEDAKSEEAVEEVKSEEVAKDAKSDEVAEDAKSDEVAEDAKSEEVVEDAKSDEVVEDAKSEEVVEDAKSEEVVEDAKSDEVAEDAKSEEVVEDAKSEEVVEDAKSEEVVEESKSEEVVEESKSDEVAEDAKSDEVAEDAKSDEVAEDAKSDEIAEEAKSEEVVEDAKSDEAVEDAKSDEVVEESKSEEVVEDAKSEEVVEDAKSDEVVEDAKCEDALPGTVADCCESIYRFADLKDDAKLDAAVNRACELATSQADAEMICDALDEVGCYELLAVALATMTEKIAGESAKRLLSADRADVLDLRLAKREEALEIATPLSEGDDRAAYKAKAVLAGNDADELKKIAASITDWLKKLRRTPEEVPVMVDLAHLYSERLGAMKEAEEQYKRVKMAEPKNSKMLRFYCRYYESTGDWQRVLSSLQTLKGAVAGSYRELNVSREIARVSEDKLNNPGKAVNVWNQMLKDGIFVDVAREELIGLYKRTQKWQALLDIYKNDMEALPKDQIAGRVAILKQMIEIYDQQLHLDAMVIKNYHQILEIDPENDEAVDALIERYEASKRWNDLLKILTQKAESTTDKDACVDIYYRIANLWSNSLGNMAKAIDPLLKVVELDPTQRKALRQLHEFYEQRNNWANLYDIIAKEAVVAEGGEKIALLKRQAEIGETNLRSAEKAIESWEAMSLCLNDPSEALEELIRLYTKLENYEALLGVYERGLEHAHNESERVDQIDKMASLYIEHLNARDKGIATLHKMLEIEEGRDQALDRLTQLHVDAAEWDDLVKLYLDLDRAPQVYELLDLTAGDQDDVDVQIELYERMASVAQDTLSDDEMVIGAYEKILEVDSTHEKTAKRLLSYYKDRGEHAKAIEAIQIIIAWTSDHEEKIAKHVEISSLYENELADLDNAVNWYAKAVALAPERKAMREHFEMLVDKNEARGLLYDVYSAQRSNESLDAESRVDIHRVLARTCQNDLNKPEDAIACWEVCMAANEHDMEAIDALSSLYEEVCSWEKLLAILDSKLAHTEDADEIQKLSFKRAGLLVSQLQNLEEAEKSFEKVLELDDSNLDAIRGLKSIYDVTENWVKYAEMLGKERDLVTDGRLDIIYDLAETERTHLNHLEEAIQLYASILDEDPNHARTISTLEELIRDGVEPARLAAILEPVYEQAGEHAKRCDVLEIRLRSLEKEEKIAALWQIYQLRHDELDDRIAAFDVCVRLFSLNPEDERVWDNLDALAEAVDDEAKWQQISRLFADIPADEDFNDEWRYEILRRRALIVEEKLNNEADSIVLWEQLYAHDNEKLENIEHLDKLYKSSSAYDKLVKLLEFKANLSDFSDDERINIELEAAQIYEDILEKSDDAIRVYCAVLEIDNAREEALSALERLYAACEKWAELAALLEEEQSIYSDADKVKSIRMRLADVCDMHLADYDRAIECYRSVLESDHSDDVVSASDALLKKLVNTDVEKVADYRASLCELLEPIYVEKSDLSALIAVLRIKLADCDDDYDKVELNRRIANILRNDLDDQQGAFDAVKAALRIDISDEALRSDFETLALQLEASREIIDLYEASLDKVDDDVLKHDLYQRMAGVYRDGLEDNANAIKCYRAMIELDDMDSASLDALENLYTSEENWKELIDILHRKAEIGSGDEKVDILRKTATINRDFMNDTKAAIDSYREILDNVSDDMDALNALESLYAQTENWECLCENYGTKLQLTSDDEEKRTILREMAKIQEEKLKDYPEATQLYVQIMDIFPSDEDTLNSLDRLYLSQECYDDLCDILTKKLELNRDSELADAIEYRLGQIYQTKLESVEQAIEYYKSILDRRPEHEDANIALRGLLENEDYRLDASRVLESVYDRTEQHAKLAEILEIQLAEESDPYAQVELLKRIADIHQNKLGSYENAFNDYARIVKLDQDSAYLEQIESLSEILNNTAALVDVYKDVVENVYEPELQVSLNNKIAGYLQDRLEDEAQAEKFYKATLEVQSDDTHALDALDGIYTKREAWKDLLDILDAKIQANPDPEAQMPLLYRTAEIQEAKCQAHDDAIGTYQRVLELDQNQKDARSALAKIYEEQEMWSELSDLIRTEIDDAADDLDAVLALKFKLAKIQNEKLNDDYDAIQTLQDIVNTKSDYTDAVVYLEGMFEGNENTVAIADILEPIYKSTQDWHKLIHSLEVRAKMEDDDYSKAQILNDIARTWNDNVEDTKMALETYGRILMLQPTDADIQKNIETLASKTLELQTWADLYTRVLDENLVDDYQDKRVIMISLARLLAERLDNHDKARELCRAMLAEEAEEMEAYDILEWSYAQKKDYSALLALWTEKAEFVQDQDEKLALMLRMATIQEEIANDDMAACKTYQAMLEIDQNAANACAALERLLRKTEQYKELTDFYRNQSDYASNDADRVEYMHKLGVVLARELHDIEEATEVLENALSIQRDSAACKRAVESMLASTEATDENAEIRCRMATLLEPLYEDDEWVKLARVLNVLIETSDDPSNKVGLYMREAALYETHDAHNGRAFDTYAKAFISMPSTAEAREKLEEHAKELNNYDVLTDVYEKAIQACEDELDKVALYERVAVIYSEKLDNNEKAAECYEAILKIDEFNINAITALETLYAKAQKYGKLVSVLTKHAENVSNMLDQKDLYYRIAEIQESALNNIDDAVATYHAILELDAEDQISLDALEKLYESNEKWNELIDIYKRKMDASCEASERVELSVKAAYTYKNRLNDVDSAIENYVQALSEDAENMNILTSLEDLYTETKRYDDLLETLETKVNCDAANKHEHQLKMAKILIENVNDHAQAIEVLKSVLDENPDTTDAIIALNDLLKNDDLVAEIADILMPIYKNSDRNADYVSLCERRIEVTTEDYEKRDIYMDAATVADEKLNDGVKAYSFIIPALLANPTDDEIIEKAEAIANRYEAYTMLTDLCEKVIADANDPDAALKLSLLAAKYYEEKLNNIEKTIAQFERMLEIDALHETALENLHRLYKQTNHAKLPEILEKRIEAGAQPMNDIRYELVELKLEAEPAETLELLKAILWEDKAYNKAYDALEKLLAHKNLILDIAEFLEPRYNETGEHDKQASLLKARIEVTEDTMDAIALLKQLAKLQQDVLNDEKAAFDTYVNALAKDPADADVLSAIENIAENLGLWTELAQAYPKAIEASSDDSDKISLYAKLAKVFSDKLQNHDEALKVVKSILEIDAENMDALHHMESIYTATENDEELLNTKARLADLTFEMDEQKGILYQCADLALNKLGQNERGIAFLEKIIEIDDAAIDAINPLLTLYAEAEAHDKYVDLLNKKLLSVNDNDARYDIYVDIAQTSANKLNDMVGAIEAYRSALDIKRSAHIYKALEELYTKHEQYQELDDLYMAMLDETTDAEAKAAIRIKRANIAEKHFNDDMQAIDLLKDALADDPTSADAFNALDAIYSKNGNFQDLYDLLKEQKEAATSDDLKLTFSIRIAKLAATHLGDANAAIESLSDVLNMQPNNIEAMDSLVTIHEQQKSYDLALNVLQKKLGVVGTNEEKSDVYCHVASIIRKANWDIEQVEKSYNAALNLNTKNEKALNELFEIAKNNNNLKRQLELLNIKADNEENVDARNATFLIIADMAATEFPKVSAAALARVFATKSDDIELGEKLVNAYIKAGDVDNAKPVLETIIETLTSSKQTKRLPPFYSLKGRMLKQAGDVAGARAAFEAANAIDKNNVPNNLELGIMLYEAEEYDAALKVMQSLLLQQMNVKDKEVKTNIFYYLGMLRVKTNDPKRAKDMFNRALGVDPNHAPTKEALAAL